MGRHSKRSASKVRRNSLLAIAGLAPTGLVAFHTSAQPATSTAMHAEPAIRPELAGAAAAVAQPAAATEPDFAPLVTATTGPTAIPAVAGAAYRAAERTLAQQQPACAMPWQLLAGIGRIESRHAANGKTDASGRLTSPILGPVLDGSLSGNNVITDTDRGALDGNASYDRAVGPMQFLPQTWQRYSADGNGDNIIDPQNIFDASLTAGRYLCEGRLDMRDPLQRARAIRRYNNSAAYVANVLAWETAYRTGTAPTPSSLPRI